MTASSTMHDLAGRDDRRACAQLSILYDRSATGEFFHAYTHAFDGRFFFEIVQRRDYDGFGAVNASVRLAAQALSERPVARHAGRARAVRATCPPRREPVLFRIAGPTPNRGTFMTFFVARIAAAAAALLALSGAALAHTGAGAASSFAHGFVHPIGGLDHVLAMVAVGLYAALLGGRALWLVPATFVGVMAIGGALGHGGLALPYAEIGIALSVIVLGLAVALRISLPTLAAMALAGLFAIFHGHAHGAEMPQTISGHDYAAGFMLATALLHGVGIALGVVGAKSALARRAGRRRRDGARGRRAARIRDLGAHVISPADQWSAKQYTAFEAERTRPVRDLVAALPNRAAKTAIDLGCGPGNSTEVLAAAFPDAKVTGLDNSPDMIAAARKRLPQIQFELADLTSWSDPGPFDVILSNAVMQWVPGHDVLFPRLVSRSSAPAAASRSRCRTMPTSRRCG